MGEIKMKYTLGSQDVQKILKGLIIALIGATLTYLSAVIVKVDFGIYTPLIVSFWSVIANTVWKILDGVKS